MTAKPPLRVVTIVYDPETDGLEITGEDDMNVFELYGLLTTAVQLAANDIRAYRPDDEPTV